MFRCLDEAVTELSLATLFAYFVLFCFGIFVVVWRFLLTLFRCFPGCGCSGPFEAVKGFDENYTGTVAIHLPSRKQGWGSLRFA